MARELKELQTEDTYWYVATVFTSHPGGKIIAFRDAAVIGAWLVQRGVHVYVPIAHGFPISEVMQPPDHSHETWLAQDKPFVKNAIGLVVTKMPGWETSKGITQEIKWAHEHGQKVRYLEWPLNE